MHQILQGFLSTIRKLPTPFPEFVLLGGHVHLPAREVFKTPQIPIFFKQASSVTSVDVPALYFRGSDSMKKASAAKNHFGKNSSFQRDSAQKSVSSTEIYPETA
jgi:hypothetical protein